MKRISCISVPLNPQGMTDLLPACPVPTSPAQFGAVSRLSSPHDSWGHQLIYSRSWRQNKTKSSKTSPRFVKLHGTSQHFRQNFESKWLIMMKLRSPAAPCDFKLGSCKRRVSAAPFASSSTPTPVYSPRGWFSPTSVQASQVQLITLEKNRLNKEHTVITHTYC